MNFAPRLALLVPPLLLMLGLPAHAQDVEVGTGLICDTQEQVERYVSTYDGDAQSTVDSVNAAERDPTACGMATVVFVRGRQLSISRNKDKTFQIVPILVLGLVTEKGIKSVEPAPFFSGFEIQEFAI